MSLTDSTIDYLCFLLIMASNYNEPEKPPNLIIISKNLHVRNSLIYIMASGGDEEFAQTETNRATVTDSSNTFINDNNAAEDITVRKC